MASQVSMTTPSCAALQGPILAFIWAVRELLEDRREAGTGSGSNENGLPVNVVFCLEGCVPPALRLRGAARFRAVWCCKD